MSLRVTPCADKETLGGSAPSAQQPLIHPVGVVQVDLDQLDQNSAVNKAGAIVGSFKAATNSKISDTALQPYDEVFGLQRFRETELIHGR